MHHVIAIWYTFKATAFKDHSKKAAEKWDKLDQPSWRLQNFLITTEKNEADGNTVP